jgi:two-component system, chemotaxis family, protein-glutamate methylesterase/glutaminase
MLQALSRPILHTGSKLRVLVVDDSVVIRRLVTHVLSEDPEIEVVGSAATGSIALQRIPQLNPDAITLDIEMPEMDGIETLRRIRRKYPGICVIMFSTLTERGAASTLEALAAGANEYVTKASNAGSLDRSLESLRKELVPKIKQFFTFEKDSVHAASEPPGPTTLAHSLCPAIRPRPQVAVIGVSTGGPAALAEAVPMFPRDFPLPNLVVQHMPPMFTRLLAERLQQRSALEVREASDGMKIERGRVIIAQGDYHLRIAKEGAHVVARLDQSPPENSCRPAADVLFRSVADQYGGACIAAVMTGMGQDGFRGAEVLKARGAYVIAQDEQTSVVWGMPGYVAKAGLADAVLPLRAIVPEIIRQAG